MVVLVYGHFGTKRLMTTMEIVKPNGLLECNTFLVPVTVITWELPAHEWIVMPPWWHVMLNTIKIASLGAAAIDSGAMFFFGDPLIDGVGDTIQGIVEMMTATLDKQERQELFVANTNGWGGMPCVAVRWDAKRKFYLEKA